MSQIRSIPCTVFDHLVWSLQTGEGEVRQAQTALGPCLLLFTSLDSLYTFVETCEDREDAQLRPVVFSRNRREFGERARNAIRSGAMGALFDPVADTGEAPLLRFSRAGS